MNSAGGVIKAKKLEAAVATATAEATSSPILLLLLRRRRSLRCSHPAGTGLGTPMARACILFKNTGLQTALQRGSLIEAAMPALLSIHNIVDKDEQVNNIVLEKEKKQYYIQ